MHTSDILETTKDYVVEAANFGVQTSLYLGVEAVAWSASLIPFVRNKASALETRQQAEYRARSAAFMAWRAAQEAEVRAIYNLAGEPTAARASEPAAQEPRHTVTEALQAYFNDELARRDQPGEAPPELSQNGQAHPDFSRV